MSLTSAVLLLLAPEPVTRDGAREAARRELSKAVYQRERPSLVQRLLDASVSRLQDALNAASEAAPGGGWGLAALLLVLVALVVVIRLRLGPLARRSAAAEQPGFVPQQNAAEHRRLAAEYAAEGNWAEAVRERMRAIVRDLEDRTVLEPRPARTADEVAAEAAAVLPEVAADLARAALAFDDVWYGGRPATAQTDALLRAVDSRVAAARPAGSAMLGARP